MVYKPIPNLIYKYYCSKNYTSFCVKIFPVDKNFSYMDLYVLIYPHSFIFCHNCVVTC